MGVGHVTRPTVFSYAAIANPDAWSRRQGEANAHAHNGYRAVLATVALSAEQPRSWLWR